jgi:hypothetical protein
VGKQFVLWDVGDEGMGGLVLKLGTCVWVGVGGGLWIRDDRERHSRSWGGKCGGGLEVDGAKAVTCARSVDGVEPVCKTAVVAFSFVHWVACWGLQKKCWVHRW